MRPLFSSVIAYDSLGLRTHMLVYVRSRAGAVLLESRSCGFGAQ